MISVEIENFQSIEHLRVSIRGFTAIVGGSDLGKSAIVRAIRSALTGASGTDFVRHGAACERRLKNNKKCRCFTSVRIETEKLSLKWEKGDGVNRYTVHQPPDAPPAIFDRVDRGTPDFLQPDFTPIKIGDAPTLLQVADQFRVNGVGGPIFLLDVSGNAVAEVISDVARLDDLSGAMRLVQKDRKEAASTRNVRQQDVQRLRTELSCYDGLDQALARVRTVEERAQELSRMQLRCDHVARLATTFQGLGTDILSLSDVLRPTLPDEETLQAAWQRTSRTDALLQEVAARTPDVRRLMGVDKILVPELNLGASFDRLLALDKWSTHDQMLCDAIALGEQAEVLEVPAPEGLTGTLSKIQQLQSWIEREALLLTRVSELEQSVILAETEEKEALTELRSLGLCPTCSRPIGAEDHLHFEEAS